MKLRELKRWDKFKLLGHEHTTYKFDTYDCIDSALKTDVYFCYNMLDGRRCRFSGDLDVILPPFNIKIYYFSPFDSEKNIGRSHNQHCAIVPNAEDWICITDSDVLFLLPDTKKQIEDVIRKHGSTYQVFGCLTNRIASPHQRSGYGDIYNLFDDTDIMSHKRVARNHAHHYNNEVKETDINIAGFLMVFQKKTWDKYRFSDNSIRFDSEFTDKVKADGGRLAIMRGVYVFHDYRLGHENPMYYIDHLK